MFCFENWDHKRIIKEKLDRLMADDKLKIFYAGETNQTLLACLVEHISGNGPAVADQPHLLPWAIAAFAFTFSSAAIRNHNLLSIQHNMDVQKFSKLSTAIAFIEESCKLRRLMFKSVFADAPNHSSPLRIESVKLTTFA